jgi:hypothetical protein
VRHSRARPGRLSAWDIQEHPSATAPRARPPGTPFAPNRQMALAVRWPLVGGQWIRTRTVTITIRYPFLLAGSHGNRRGGVLVQRTLLEFVHRLLDPFTVSRVSSPSLQLGQDNRRSFARAPKNVGSGNGQSERSIVVQLQPFLYSVFVPVKYLGRHDASSSNAMME